MSACELCDATQGDILYINSNLRVILVDDAHYPGFCRVIWNAHVQEMSDLSVAERNELMDVVWRVEFVIREVMQPHKINLASLGNMVPHLHWHIIPRYRDDAHFPNPIWGAIQRPDADSSARLALLPSLRAALHNQLFHS